MPFPALLGTVVLAGLNPSAEPTFINGTYFAAGLDADGEPHVLAVDADGNLSGGSGGIVASTVRRTAGDVALSTGAVLVEASSALRVTVPAATGDLLVCFFDIYITPGNRSVVNGIATIVSGSIVNQFGGVLGNASMYVIRVATDGNQANAVGGAVAYTVQAGDISGGNVTVSLTSCNETTGGTAATLAANTNHPAVLTLVNFGQ